MKILLICPEDIKGERRGGVTTYILNLAKCLTRLNNEVFLLTPGDQNNFFIQDNYKVFRISTLVNIKKNGILRILIKGLYKGLRGLRKLFPGFTDRLYWAFNVLVFIKEKGPFDIIEAPEWGNSALLVSLFSKSKVVVKLHRGWYCYNKDNELPMNLDVWLMCLLEFLSIIFATAITSPTRYMLSYYKPLLSIFKKIGKRKLIEIIPYGIEIKPIKRLDTGYVKEKKYLLSVGRLEKAKGSFLLLQAFKQVVKQFKDVKLIFIGEDTEMLINEKLRSYKKYLKSYIYRNHLEKSIQLLSKKNSEQLGKYYSNCLFFIAPSVGRENAPLVLLEAISYNKAVMGSNTGGIPEIIKDKINGLLFAPNNVRDLAQKIEFFLENAKLRLKFEEYNNQYKKQFDVRIRTQQTLSFYKRVING